MTDLLDPVDPKEVQPQPDPGWEAIKAKYKDEDGITKAINEKDRFIEQLKTETAGLRTELATRTKMEEIKDLIVSARQTPAVAPALDAPVTTQVAPAVPEEDLEKRIERKLAQAQEKALAEANIKLVRSKLLETFGSEFAAKVKAAAMQLELGEEFLNSVAAKNPAAFFKLLGIEQGVTPRRNNDLTPPSSVHLPPGQIQRKNYAFYEQIRKTDVNKYWSPAVQNEMLKQLEEQGQEEFYKP